MGRAENRSEDYRVWKNRLNDIFNRYNVEDKEDFKDIIIKMEDIINERRKV